MDVCVCETIFKSTSGSFSGNIYYANCNTTDNFNNKRESQQKMKYEQIWNQNTQALNMWCVSVFERKR